VNHTRPVATAASTANVHPAISATFFHHDRVLVSILPSKPGSGAARKAREGYVIM
jgi:hypothetical protein